MTTAPSQGIPYFEFLLATCSVVIEIYFCIIGTMAATTSQGNLMLALATAQYVGNQSVFVL